MSVRNRQAADVGPFRVGLRGKFAISLVVILGVVGGLIALIVAADIRMQYERRYEETAVYVAEFLSKYIDGDRVLGFEEKPAQADGFINGGFMVVSRSFLVDYLPQGDDDVFFEREPMARCAADGRMQVYKHHGFWQCMDNQREYHLLNSLWNSGAAPWTKYWK